MDDPGPGVRARPVGAPLYDLEVDASGLASAAEEAVGDGDADAVGAAFGGAEGEGVGFADEGAVGEDGVEGGRHDHQLG